MLKVYILERLIFSRYARSCRREEITRSFVPTILILAIGVFISGCETTAPASTNQVQNSIPQRSVTYRDGMTCRETTTPNFRMLGLQCICSDPYKSDNYSVRSNKAGYTTECQNPQVWAANQDRLAAEQREFQRKQAEEERIAAAKAAREAKEREDLLRKLAPHLNPYCQALARRKANIVRQCDTAANPSYCMSSRDQSTPVPALPKALEGASGIGIVSTCYTQGFDVIVNVGTPQQQIQQWLRQGR